ncbi:MAG TPA: S41 family peptidase [Bdellovibrionota bacterium]
MLGLFSLSLWLALAPPPSDLHSSDEKTNLVLPASLLESRLSLCHASNSQQRGCSAALTFLEELAHPSLPPSEISRSGDPEREFARLKQRLQNAKVPEGEWVSGAFNAWLNALDPHAKLVSAVDADRRASAEKILVQGAGAKLRFHHGRVYVGYSMEGSAAESIGLRPGDRILALNGKELERLNDPARRRWLSETVSPYRIRIEREGRQKSMEIVEKRYFLANVESRLREDTKEGLLRVRSFDKDNTCAELRTALKSALVAGATSLRLDLSDNPGGLVREAQCVAGLFLGPGKTFARLKRVEDSATKELIPAVIAGGSLGGSEETVLNTEGKAATTLPLVVEINQNTASAAEMLAASLQDNQRARIAGTRSFGKGSMQSVFHPWSDEKLYLTRTTHAIFRPSGKALQFEGVQPDLASRKVEGENFPRERELTL